MGKKDQDKEFGAIGADSTGTVIEVSAGGTLRAGSISIGGQSGGLEIDGGSVTITNGAVYVNGEQVN